MNAEINILLESAWTASIIPLAYESTLAAMKAFGGYDLLIPCILSVMGATVGQSFNWLIGRFLLKLRNKGKITVSDYWYNRIATLFNTYGIFLLLFSWAPLCNLLVVLAGFTGTRLLFILPLIIAGEAFHYGQYLL